MCKQKVQGVKALFQKYKLKTVATNYNYYHQLTGAVDLKTEIILKLFVLFIRKIFIMCEFFAPSLNLSQYVYLIDYRSMTNLDRKSLSKSNIQYFVSGYLLLQ